MLPCPCVNKVAYKKKPVKSVLLLHGLFIFADTIFSFPRNWFWGGLTKEKAYD